MQDCKDMSKVLKEQAHLVVTIQQLLDSEIFQADALRNLADSLYVILYSLLDVAHEFYRLNEMKQEVY